MKKIFWLTYVIINVLCISIPLSASCHYKHDNNAEKKTREQEESVNKDTIKQKSNATNKLAKKWEGEKNKQSNESCQNSKTSATVKQIFSNNNNESSSVGSSSQTGGKKVRQKKKTEEQLLNEDMNAQKIDAKNKWANKKKNEPASNQTSDKSYFMNNKMIFATVLITATVVAGLVYYASKQESISH